MQAITNRAAKAGVDWFIWRLVMSPQIPDGLHTILQKWSFVDVIVAHKALDAHDEIVELMRERARE